MPPQTLRGFVWYAYPDVFGLDPDEAGDPGHPFASTAGPAIAPPPEVVYYRRANPADTGVRNERRDPSYLVLTNTQHHPRVSRGWDSEPAVLSEGFKTSDGRLRMIKIIQQHHRHAGDLLECELRYEKE